MYNMPMSGPPQFVSRKDLKRAARESLRTDRPSVWKVTLVYLLLTSGLFLLLNLVLGGSVASTRDMLAALLTYTDPQQLLAALAAPDSPVAVPVFFLQILLQLYAAVLSFGYYSYTLRRSRGETAGFSDLLSGFGMAGRVILMNLIILAFSLCWTVLVMVPVSLILSLLVTVFAMGSYFYAPSAEVITVQLAALYVVLIVLLIIAALIILFLLLRYVLSPFCLADHPDGGSLEAVRRSRALLYARRGEVFKLVLSFLGWSILNSVLSVLVSSVCMGLGCAFFLTSGSLAALTAGIAAGQVLSFLLPLPLAVWLQGYYAGTLARYYCAVSDAAQPADEWRMPGEGSRPL